MSNKNEFTDRERQLMSYAWQCFDGEPKVTHPLSSIFFHLDKKLLHLITSPPRPSSLRTARKPHPLTHQPRPQVNYKKLASLAGMTNPQSAVNAWARIKKKIQAQAAEEAGTADGSGSGGDSAAGSAGNGEEASAKSTPGTRKRGKGKAEVGEEESPTKKVKAGTKGKGKGKKAGCEGGKGVGEVKAEPDEEDGVMV